MEHYAPLIYAFVAYFVSELCGSMYTIALSNRKTMIALIFGMVGSALSWTVFAVVFNNIDSIWGIIPSALMGEALGTVSSGLLRKRIGV